MYKNENRDQFVDGTTIVQAEVDAADSRPTQASFHTTEIYRSYASLAPLREEWDELARICRNPLVSYDAVTACARVFYAPQDLFFIALRDRRGSLAALAPLAFRRDSRLRRWLEIVGGSVLYEPTNLLHARNGDIDSLIMSILRHSTTPTRLQRLPSTTPDPRTIDGATRMRGFYFERDSAASQYVETACSFADLEASMSSKRRNDLRRAYKRASKAGTVNVRILRPSPGELPNLLRRAFEVENASWKGRMGSSILSSPAMSSFLSQYLASLSERRQAVIGFLDIDDDPVAMGICIDAYEKLWVLKIGYRESASAASPGMLLMHEMIRFCCDNALKCMELLGAAENWLNAWPVRTHEYKSVVYYPWSAAGLSAFGWDSLKHAIERLRNRKAQS